MPKPYTFPTLYNELKSISITMLRKYGYLKKDYFLSGVISWNRAGEKTGSISIAVYNYNDSPYVRLSYKWNNTSMDYKIQLQKQPSNLGKGNLLFFICPKTYKRCTKLHLINGIFQHRTNCKSGMYESQTRSKKLQQIEKCFGCYLDYENIREAIEQKHLKKTYEGKYTKRYLKLKNKLQKAESVPKGTLTMLLMGK